MEHARNVSSHQVLENAKQDQDRGTLQQLGPGKACFRNSMSHVVPALEMKNATQHSTSGRFPCFYTLIRKHNMRTCVYIMEY